MEHLKYGLLNENLVHIGDVSKGLSCNCLCPHCNAQLIARKGPKKAHHFAHYKLSDCNHGTETALHIMAKNIVAKSRRVFVPYVPQDIYGSAAGGKVCTFENAVIEKQLSDTIRGDVLLFSGERLLNVEIKVTHEIDWKKAIDLFNLGIPTIEIDLSDLKLNFTPDIIEQRLLTGEFTTLTFSPKNKEIFAKLILGEWKKVHNYRYVEDCPFSRRKAYFLNYLHKGGMNECHECYAYTSYNPEKRYLLCLGILDSFDFSKIEKILALSKEENHIRYVKLLMSDGSIVEKES